VDFVDRTTHELIELTTLREVARHMARNESYRDATYAIYKFL
jgi:hypothetical protein